MMRHSHPALNALLILPAMISARLPAAALSAQAQQASILSSAKQIGLALSLYAQDHGDAYPNEGELEGALAPYLKQIWMLDGFHFSVSGRKEATIGNPAETEAGWIMGPTGRVILYVDGHVAVQK